MTNLGHNARYAYLVTLIGVALMALTTVYGAIRSMMIRAAFRVRTGNFTGNGNFAGPRQFGNAFGFPSSLTIIAIIIAIVGIAWLGFAMRGSQKGNLIASVPASALDTSKG